MIVAEPPPGPSGVGLGHGWARTAAAVVGTGALPWDCLGRSAGPPAELHAVATTLRPMTIVVAARMAPCSDDQPWTPLTPQRFRTRPATGGPLAHSPTGTGCRRLRRTRWRSGRLPL